MMKKRWILLMMCACISGLGGCGKQTVTEKAEETETADSMKEDTTELCAYIKEINGNTLVIDPVEYISSGDSDRLASYKHTDDDMPDGYYIYNKDEKTEEVTLTDQTEYSLLDWTREFGGTDADIRVVTKDKMIFDVGHQCYTHKILTGRSTQFATLRKRGGLSGYQKRSESKYDCREAGNSTTSLSAALG